MPLNIVSLSQAKKIIDKIRRLYGHIPDYKYVVSQKARVIYNECNDGEFSISDIEFNSYDSILVDETSITYVPEHGKAKTLLEYKSWDELLNL